LPIALVFLSVASDLCARLTRAEPRRAAFRAVGFGALVVGLLGGGLAIAAGYWDMNRAALEPDTHELADLHLTIGWVLAGALAVLTAWRWLIWHRGQMTINTGYLVAGGLVLLLTVFQAWYGGEMVFSHGAGVAAAGQGTQNPEVARRRLIAVRHLLEPGAPAMGGAESPGGTNQSPSVP
jgi:uncharacterized membrane protein